VEATFTGGTLATVSAAVLTGGESTRMGRDKARLEIAGEAAVVRIARLLASLVGEVLVVGGEPPDTEYGRFVADVEGPQCAMRGLATALSATEADRMLIVATDLPLVTPDLLLALIAWPEADAVVPRTVDGAHPLCGLYARDAVLPVALERLAGADLSMSGLLAAIEPAYIEPADLARVDPDGVALTNLNSAEDLERVRAHATLQG
jgi:molybdopterin-guanine dinucleotide biosynthesis protein A